jgi:Cthe_2314-like HEPN
MFEEIDAEDWDRIAASYPFEKLLSEQEDFTRLVEANGVKSFSVNWETPDLWMNFQNRVIHLHWSYVYLMYYFLKGIPDNPWYISPGKNGESIEYFPLFDDVALKNSTIFNYFSDTFFFKLGSVLDNLGHLLVVVYGLRIKEPDFHKAVESLATTDGVLYAKFDCIRKLPEFKDMKGVRNNVTHNASTGHVSGAIQRFPNGFSFGVGQYTNCEEVVRVVRSSLDVLVKIIDIVKSHKPG